MRLFNWTPCSETLTQLILQAEQMCTLHIYDIRSMKIEKVVFGVWGGAGTQQMVIWQLKLYWNSAALGFHQFQETARCYFWLFAPPWLALSRVSALHPGNNKAWLKNVLTVNFSVEGV